MMSILDMTLLLPICSSTSSTRGMYVKGHWSGYGIDMFKINAYSCTFRTVTMGEAQLLWDCLMYLLSKSQPISLLTLSFRARGVLYGC